MDETVNNDVLADSFRQAMRLAVSSVYVVATESKGEWHGMTATAVAPVSMAPPSILVCVNRSAAFHLPFSGSERYSINTLAAHQVDIASQFSSPEQHTLRFTTGDWKELDGVPVLLDAQSNIICESVAQHEFGTHSITIGHVLAIETRDTAPLLYGRGKYLDLP